MNRGTLNRVLQGKYVEIQFSRGGEPIGGKISNFLLEKVRYGFFSATVIVLTSVRRSFGCVVIYVFNYNMTAVTDMSQQRENISVLNYSKLNQTKLNLLVFIQHAIQVLKQRHTQSIALPGLIK